MVVVSIPEFSVPTLEDRQWQGADSLPEITRDFDDSEWTMANITSSTNPYKPHFGKYVLYGCDYGFCEGHVLWRGYYKPNGNEQGLRLKIRGGQAFSASVWLNELFLGSLLGNSSNHNQEVDEIERNFTGFSSYFGQLQRAERNVITILADNMGQEECIDGDSETMKTPRGITGYELLGGDFEAWKVQGRAGGFEHFRDRARGFINEGGLYGERAGWHLPEFDASNWEAQTPFDGFDQAGVMFYRTNFELDLPRGFDIPVSLAFSADEADYRALLYINGWQFGHRIANLGPQTKFPLPPGILNCNGQNTLVVALWALTSKGARIGSLTLEVGQILHSALGR